MKRYTCEMCKQTYDTTDEDEAAAIIEFEKQHPGVDRESETVRICDPCYQEVVIPWMKEHMP